MKKLFFSFEGKFNFFRLNNFLSEFIKVKMMIKKFYKLARFHEIESIYLEDIMSQFSRKTKEDADMIGHLKYIADDMIDLIKDINESHVEIYKALDVLTYKQTKISNFMVKLNKKISEVNKEKSSSIYDET